THVNHPLGLLSQSAFRARSLSRQPMLGWAGGQRTYGITTPQDPVGPGALTWLRGLDSQNATRRRRRTGLTSFDGDLPCRDDAPGLGSDSRRESTTLRMPA